MRRTLRPNEDPFDALFSLRERHEMTRRLDLVAEWVEKERAARRTRVLATLAQHQIRLGSVKFDGEDVRLSFLDGTELILTHAAADHAPGELAGLLKRSCAVLFAGLAHEAGRFELCFMAPGGTVRLGAEDLLIA